jgi:hypothetical protein
LSRREARGDGGYDMELGEPPYIPLVPVCLSFCTEPRSRGNPRQHCSRLSFPTKIRSATAALSASYTPTGLVHRGLPLPPSPSQGPSTFGFPTTRPSPNGTTGRRTAIALDTFLSISSPPSMGNTLVVVFPLFRVRRKSLSCDAAPHSDCRTLAQAPRSFILRPTCFTLLQRGAVY